MKIDLDGYYKITIKHKDGSEETRLVKNKLNRELRYRIFQMLRNESMGNLSSWYISKMQIGSGLNPPTDHDTGLGFVMDTFTDMTKQPASVTNTSTEISWHKTVAQSILWDEGRSLTEIGMFVNWTDPSTSMNQMISHVQVTPPIRKTSSDIADIDFILRIGLNEIEDDPVSNGDLYGC